MLGVHGLGLSPRIVPYRPKHGLRLRGHVLQPQCEEHWHAGHAPVNLAATWPMGKLARLHPNRYITCMPKLPATQLSTLQEQSLTRIPQNMNVNMSSMDVCTWSMVLLATTRNGGTLCDCCDSSNPARSMVATWNLNTLMGSTTPPRAAHI